ncbi:hypothetical protein OA994_01370 [Candidatus Pelagibacter sp.]|nr:hypothetical protein [Candidatus Pelagibacter sp.]
MKYSFLFLSFILMLTTIVRADIETAKGQCADIGFKPGTEKYADCVMKLMSKEDNNNEISNNTDKTTKKKDKKVEGDASKLVFEKATYVGEIKKGKADGFGVFTFSDGSTYEGKVKRNKIKGNGKYIDVQGKVYEGKWRHGVLKIKVEKKTRKIIKLRAKTGVHIYLEMKGEGVVSNQWFECECERDFSSCELTPKGKKDQDRAKKEKESEGSDDTSGGCG